MKTTTTADLLTDYEGARVCGGTEGTGDYDEGTVIAIEGDDAEVSWDSGVITTQPWRLLRAL